MILISEADTIAPDMATRSAWDDVFEIFVVAAVSAEEGMAIARQAMAK